MANTENFLVGIFDDDEVLMKAIKNIRNKGIKIHEVFTPFPLHGLDKALGYEYPRMGVAAFLFGLMGTICALTLTIWTLGYDWPVNVGGKDHVAFPDFIPITFELTVLLAAFGMVGTFLVKHKLSPSAKPKIFDLRSTDDKFVMAIDLAENKENQEAIASALREVGAKEVNVKQF